MHFAGRKAVGESVQEPMLYYTHNVVGTVNLIEAMRKHNVKKVTPILAYGSFKKFGRNSKAGLIQTSSSVG